MITGASQADVALVMVPCDGNASAKGIHKAGEIQGQSTPPHQFAWCEADCHWLQQDGLRHCWLQLCCHHVSIFDF